MKTKITTKQLLATTTLLKNLKSFADMKAGTINKLQVATNELLTNTIVVRYEKEFSEMGGQKNEFKIATINQNGDINFIQDGFKDIFEKAAFVSECINFDISNPNNYEKID